MKETKTIGLPMNLQLFAENGEGGNEPFGNYDPNSVYEGIEQGAGTPEGTPPQGAEGMPGEGTPEGGVPGEEGMPPEGEGTPEGEPGSNPYEQQMQQMEQQMQQMAQQTQMLQQINQQQLEQMTQMQSMLNPQQQVTAAQQQNQQPNHDEFMDRFYENSTGTIQGYVQQLMQQQGGGQQQQMQQMVQELVNQQLQPMLQQQQWESTINNLQNRYQDFGEYGNDIQAILESNPNLVEDQNGMEYAYHMARSQKMNSMPTQEQMMNDPQFLQQVAQNPQVRDQILDSYMNQKFQNRQQIPNVMGAATGAQMPTMPQNSPKTLRESTKALQQFMGGL